MQKGYFRVRTLLTAGAIAALALSACTTGSDSGAGTGAAGNQAGVQGTEPATRLGTGGTTAGEATAGADAGAATTEAGTGTTGGDATAAATAAATSEAAGATSGTATADSAAGATSGTATPEAGTGATGTGTTPAGAATTIEGPNIEYNGITFDADAAQVPSVTVQTGPIQSLLGTAPTTGGTTSPDGDATLIGTVFTLNAPNLTGGMTGTGAQNIMQPRMIVVPVSESMMVDMTGAGAGATGGNTTGGTGSASGTATPAAGTGTGAITGTAGADATAGAAGMASGQGSMSTFLAALSQTLESGGTFPSTAMRDSMILTNSMWTAGDSTRIPLFQANGEVIEFQNGRGIRFITALGNENGPVQADSLYYVFHGLTNDGSQYVSAMLPIQSTLFGTQTGGTGDAGAGTGTTGTATPGTGATTGTATTGAGTIQFPEGGDADAIGEYLNQIVQGLDQAGANGTGDSQFANTLQMYDRLISSLNVSTQTP